MNTRWKDWCWSWSSSILVTWCKQPTHWKSLWCWERLRVEDEGVRRWDGWIASLMQWTWTWANSMRWWRTGRPGMLESMGHRVRHDWAQFSSVQSLSHVRLLATLWTAARQASLSITNSRSLLKLMSIKSVMTSSHLVLCHPLLLLPPVPHSIRIFSNQSTLGMRWPKYWSFSFSISPSNEHPGLISFRMDWLDLPAVQGTLKSSPTPQFKSINFSALSFLHSPTLTSIHDHWKNHSLDQMDLCWQSNVCFLICYLGWS